MLPSVVPPAIFVIRSSTTVPSISSTPKLSDTCVIFSPSMTQYALMWSKLSSSKTGYRQGLEIVKSGRVGRLRDLRVLGVEAQGDECLETSGPVLELAEPQEMVHPVLDRLDMSIEHRRVGLESDAMGRFHYVEPAVAADLFGAQRIADAGIEDFRARRRAMSQDRPREARAVCPLR